MPISPEQFDEAIRMLRSADSMVYEEGYLWLQGDNLSAYLPQIAKLLESETDPNMRGKFVELVGDADDPEYFPLLIRELSHESREVRLWAYNQLASSEHGSANAQAAHYKSTHPDEDFY